LLLERCLQRLGPGPGHHLIPAPWPWAELRLR